MVIFVLFFLKPIRSDIDDEDLFTTNALDLDEFEKLFEKPDTRSEGSSVKDEIKPAVIGKTHINLLPDKRSNHIRNHLHYPSYLFTEIVLKSLKLDPDSIYQAIKAVNYADFSKTQLNSLKSTIPTQEEVHYTTIIFIPFRLNFSQVMMVIKMN